MSELQNVPSSARQAKVLIVDDERALTDTLAVILKWGGFETLSAYDPATAVNLAHMHKPDLLITDIVFRGEQLTGVDVALAVQGSLPNCKILLFSGDQSSAALLEQARSQGHTFQFLEKPMYPADVLEKLRMTAPAA